jgi:hypothetical protein
VARWYRQDGNSDSNPKMIKAGFWGTVVFQALCRVSADHELGGEIPAEYADPEYLARRLRLDADRALAPLWASGLTPVDVLRDGVTRCRHSLLVTESDGGGLTISGWPDRNEEGSSSTVRMRKKRERDRLERLAREQNDVTGDGVTSRDSTDGRTDGTDGRTDGRASSAGSGPAVVPATPKPDVLLGLWREIAEPAGCERVRDFTEKRRAAARARLKDRAVEGEGGWLEVLQRVAASPFCRGEVPPRSGHSKPFRASFDWLFGSRDTATHVLEGRYDDGQAKPRAAEDEGYYPLTTRSP